MKKKTVEKLAPTKTRKSGYVTTVQTADDILILNVYHNKKLQGRHCINKNTGEYAQWVPTADNVDGWSYSKLSNLLGFNPVYYGRATMQARNTVNSDKEKQLIYTFLGKKEDRSWTDIIDSLEDTFSSAKRQTTECNRIRRVRDLMDLVPEVPADFEPWFLEKATGGIDYAIHDKENDLFTCSACGGSAEYEEFKRPDGSAPKFNKDVICPICGKTIRMKKKNQSISFLQYAGLFQNIDDKYSVCRYFDVEIAYEGGHPKRGYFNEACRIVLYRNDPKWSCRVFYNQYSRDGHWGGYYWRNEAADFDYKSNPAHRRTMRSCYLYPFGIDETLKGTEYEMFTRPYMAMAQGDRPFDYNRGMVRRSQHFADVIEMLYKNRFYKITAESLEGCSWYGYGLGYFFGPIDPAGRNMEEVLGLKDKQMINRLRDLDGNGDVLSWLKWSEETGKKISQAALEWVVKNNLSKNYLGFISERMNIEQIMNYVKRQQSSGYKGKNARGVCEQWSDYLSMCRKLGKHMDDEMVYRPKDLKLRHDEAVEEWNRRQAEIEMKKNKELAKQKAAEYRKRFPGGEKILKEIKPKFEWKNEEYLIVVPKNFVEIVTEGSTLHHCAGASDRYFDRIMQKETFIVFLRKASAPTIPYYTIEVEPGGTIRQHRGAYDEEPDIEKIKPALKEWQKEIRKRMNKADHEAEKISAAKRVANIEELRAKNNTRVLQGLMEDFMEAIG